ncbi:MAG: flagellar biosynthesis protein FlhB [Lachnospiraceae bacterium]|nr:flagellar biosynthesis protein FlhB [Lachnospiraceae bacterium]
MHSTTLLSYNLQFFAKEGPGGEKTEDATAKKLKDAREEGQVMKSQDVNVAVSLLVAFLILKVFIGYIGEGFLGTFQGSLNLIDNITGEPFTGNTCDSIVQYAMVRIVMIGLPLLLASFVAAIVVNVVQVGWTVTTKPMQPKFSRLNPISGFSKIISKDKLFELFKAVVKIGIIGYIVYTSLKDDWGLLMDLYSFDLFSAIGLVGSVIINLGIKMSLFFLGFAAVDYMYQRRKFKEDMKMTKQEVKDEFKNSEGDPQIKSRRRQMMRESSQRRMMQSVPDADVVITNPTHLAVAIKYDRDAGSAPIVVAKGADYVAQRLKDIAREADVEIVENKPLARMLYYNVDLDQEIPPELYQTVAEILAYVYGLKGKL